MLLDFHLLPSVIIIIIIISGFGIYGAAVVPDSGVGNTWQRLTLVLHEFLSNRLIPSRLHIVISFLTHADHVFLGLPRFLVPGTPNRVMELMQDARLQDAHCTCPYHLRRRVRRTAVISPTSSFWWSTAEEISSSSFAPQIHLIMARSFLRSRCRSEALGAQVSLPWSIVHRTQAVNTLPRVLKEMCFEVRIGNSEVCKSHSFSQHRQHCLCWENHMTSNVCSSCKFSAAHVVVHDYNFLCRVTNSAHLVVGPLLSLDQRLGIRCRITSAIRRVVTSLSDVH